MATLDYRRAEKVGLKLLKVHEHLENGHATLFKAHGLSSPQYNVLRILRGARDEDLSCQEVGARMLKRVPDVTRLLDRLERRGWIRRWRCTEDRRVVRTRMFTTDIERWENYGKAHREVFGDHPPTTSLVEVARLIHPDMLIEIEADAVVEDE